MRAAKKTIGFCEPKHDIMDVFKKPFDYDYERDHDGNVLVKAEDGHKLRFSKEEFSKHFNICEEVRV